MLHQPQTSRYPRFPAIHVPTVLVLCPQVRKTSQPPGVCPEAHDWISHLILRSVSVTEDVNAVCHAALTAAHRNFPGAILNQQLMSMILRTMSARLPGFTPQSTLLGLSFGRDKMQNSTADLTHLLDEHFERSFNFAGLGGIPLAGKTGFKVCSGLATTSSAGRKHC